MLVTIHQPEHLPWPGFFHKMAAADLFILLDVVQFRKNYFQNRNRILSRSGTIWLTVPVLTKGHLSRGLNEVEINNSDHAWRRRCWRTISASYARHPFFSSLAPVLEAAYKLDWTHLVPLNELLIHVIKETLGIDTPIVKASELGVWHTTSSQLLLDLCLATGATTYLAGRHSGSYLDEGLFLRQGIEVRHHSFEMPTHSQLLSEDFVPDLSVLDLIFNCGEDSRRIMESGGGHHV